MIVVADENVQRTVVAALRQRGHDVRSIREVARGVSDDRVLDVANQESAVLLTYDRDFGELVFQQKLVAAGVILVRLAGLPAADIADIVASTMEIHGPEIQRAFTVITPQGVRVRRLPLS